MFYTMNTVNLELAKILGMNSLYLQANMNTKSHYYIFQIKHIYFQKGFKNTI